MNLHLKQGEKYSAVEAEFVWRSNVVLSKEKEAKGEKGKVGHPVVVRLSRPN